MESRWWKFCLATRSSFHFKVWYEKSKCRDWLFIYPWHIHRYGNCTLRIGDFFNNEPRRQRRQFKPPLWADHFWLPKFCGFIYCAATFPAVSIALGTRSPTRSHGEPEILKRNSPHQQLIIISDGLALAYSNLQQRGTLVFPTLISSLEC